jgi:3-hydroxyacyl-CoA dehydrogenase/enoyl-CoA hydratase/3-hydroxybutyryl-CoA epimerase
MPRGPLELTDDVAIDLVGRIAHQRKVLLGNAAMHRCSDDVVDLLLGAGRFGRKNGMGFYDYPASGPKVIWGALERKWPVKRANNNPAEIVELRRRLLHRQAVEAAHCLAEGVIEDPRYADVGAVLGWAFPRWTGGPISYIEQIGLPRFVDECDALADKWGGRFLPPRSLREMAASKQNFYDGLLPHPVAA